MTWVTITGDVVSTSTKFGGTDHGNKIANMFNGVDVSDTVTINSAVVWTFNNGSFKLNNPAGTFEYLFTPSAIIADRTLTLPLLTGTDTIVVEALAQTLTNKTLTSPTLVTPALGTPASGTLTNCTFPTLNQNTTGTADNVTGTVAVATGGTGSTTASAARTALGVAIGSDVQAYNSATALTTNKLSDFAATTSAELAGNISDETGSGLLVFGTSPTLVTPALGTPSALVLTNATGTLTSPTFVTPVLGTPSSGTLTSCTGLPITGITSSSSAQIATLCSDETGSGSLVFATSPTLVTPALGTPSAGVLTSCTGLPATTGLTATGTKDATTFLRGDDTWAVVDASPLTTKGDVYVYGTGNTRLAVGTNDYVLTADSTEATGLKWAAAAGGASAVSIFTNQSSTSYVGTGSAGTGIDVGVAVATEASGAGEREIYIKKIDANNEGVFTVIHKNGTTVEVQIA